MSDQGWRSGEREDKRQWFTRGSGRYRKYGQKASGWKLPRDNDYLTSLGRDTTMSLGRYFVGCEVTGLNDGKVERFREHGGGGPWRGSGVERTRGPWTGTRNRGTRRDTDEGDRGYRNSRISAYRTHRPEFVEIRAD